MSADEQVVSDFVGAMLKSKLLDVRADPDAWHEVRARMGRGHGPHAVRRRWHVFAMSLPTTVVIALCAAGIVGAASIVYEFVLTSKGNEQVPAYPTVQTSIWGKAVARPIQLSDAKANREFVVALSSTYAPVAVDRLSLPCANCAGGELTGIRATYQLPAGEDVTLVEAKAPAAKGGKSAAITVKNPATVAIHELNGRQAVVWYTLADHNEVAAIAFVTSEGTSITVYFETPVSASAALNFALSVR